MRVNIAAKFWGEFYSIILLNGAQIKYNAIKKTLIQSNPLAKTVFSPDHTYYFYFNPLALNEKSSCDSYFYQKINFANEKLQINKRLFSRNDEICNFSLCENGLADSLCIKHLLQQFKT